MLWLIALLLSPPTPAAEVVRLERWFTQATAIIEAAAPDLDRDRRARRARLLGALADYVDGGLFPANPSAGWAPVFVDADDTRCAMAHLLDVTGEDALMRRVEATANRAEVIDLADDPDFVAWLDWHGLTLAEAAAIQPSYPGPPQPSCICGVGGGFVGEVRTPSMVVHVVPDESDADALRITQVFEPGANDAFKEGDLLSGGSLDASALRGEAPWLVAVFVADPEFTLPLAAQQLPYSLPCPALTPYPGTPPPPLTDAQMATAALAGTRCPEVLAEIDSRWAYTTGCDGEEQGCGTTRPNGPTGLLLVLLLIARRRSPRRRKGSAPRDPS